MEERENLRPVILRHWDEVLSTWEGGSARKTHSLPRERLWEERRQGKQIGQGSIFSCFLPRGPETPTCTMASEISRYVWKTKEYWAVGTHPWGLQKKVTTQSKDKFVATVNTEFWPSGVQSLDLRRGEEWNNG